MKSKDQLSPNLMSLSLSQPLPFRLKDYHLYSNMQVAQVPPSMLLFIILVFPASLPLGHFYILNFSLACTIWVADAVTFVSLVKLHIMSWTWRGLKTYVMNNTFLIVLRSSTPSSWRGPLAIQPSLVYSLESTIHTLAEGNRYSIICLPNKHQFILHAGKIAGYGSDRPGFRSQLWQFTGSVNRQII